jgi:WD40 repeat protein
MDSRVLISSVNDLTKGIKLKLEGAISSIAWSPDSSRVAVGLYANENISIWDTGTGSLITILKGDKVYDGGGAYVAWNPKQEILASIANDWDSGRPLRFWETQTYSQIGSGEVFMVYPMTSSLKWRPEGLKPDN